MKSFLIIGMGTFGHILCKKLSEQKAEIMIVDKDAERVEDLLPYVVSAKIGDCTNKEVLKSFDVEAFDTCFVCIGNDFQNSLEVTSLLKELKAKKVISKAEEEIQAKFLLRNGADKVIYAEQESAERLAISESSDNIFDCFEFSEDYLVCEIAPREKWIGKSIKTLNFRTKYNMSILAVKKGERIDPLPSPEYVFKENEHIMVLGHLDDIKKV